MSNPYRRSNPIEAGLDAAASTIGIMDAVDARKDRVEDRDFQREHRGLQLAEARQGLEHNSKYRPIQLETAELGLSSARRADDRDRSWDEVLNRYVDRVRGGSGLAGLESVPGLGAAAERGDRAPTSKRSEDPEKEWAEARDWYIRAAGRVDAMSGPEGLKRVMGMANFAEALQNGDGKAIEATWPMVIDALNAADLADIEEGVGQQKVNGTEDVIVGKRLANFLSTGEGSLIPELSVTARRPDGTTYEYNAPRTEGANTDPNAKIKQIPGEQALEMFQNLLETGMDIQEGRGGRQQLDEWLRLEAMRLRRDPKELEAVLGSGKREEFKREVGNEIITYQRDARGNEREVARAPRWNPDGGASASEREYALAKREGFTGSYMDFVQAKKGNGLSVTLPDGTVVQQGGAGSTKITEQQSKDLVYHTRASGALETLDQYEGALTNLTHSLTSEIPVVGNYTVSPEFQQGEQAGREFLASILRKDTGAAVTSSEEQLYGRIFLPRPGDSAAVLAQKRRGRAIAVDAIRSGLGSAAILAKGKRLIDEEQLQQTGGAPLRDATPNPNAAARAPAEGTIEGGYRFKGGNPADPSNWERAQ